MRSVPSASNSGRGSMAPKPDSAAKYSPASTALAERVLLTIWSRLGEFREHLVLVGGLAPRYIVPQPSPAAATSIPAHCGTFDVDLAISLAVADLKTYESIYHTLTENLGFEPGTNTKGREQRHSFTKTIGNTPVILDFLTTKYEGPDNSLMHAVEENLSAIQVEGLGLAFMDPLRVDVEGDLLEDGRHRTVINVCRPVPFVMLKALALSDRGERKDAYDLVYVLRYYKNGPASVAAEVRPDERNQESFQKAVGALRNHFVRPEQDGPAKYAAFSADEPGAAVQAYAAVQEFLAALERKDRIKK